jgi:glycine/serine hydroxymethyltransferase
MGIIVSFIDEVLSNPTDEEVISNVKQNVNKMMKDLPLFKD